ncbi:hypothetical protein BDV36DRAFT_287970 [Aspergillus pseudocaelatus]|uniref:Methyltransferase-domain-containing protein n=1 Tax=Aspergillus pseudocaelatus TaxID=1825620 RepID=A0ABQ6W5G7_9EURO|nr:hypothetical protein BDV36DRAFT_287970 [Aspergillus pseudocaelatus]
MLRSRLRNLPTPSVPAPELPEELNTNINESPEDVFGAFRSHLFPDSNPPPQPGGPGQELLYGTRWGDLKIMVPGYPRLDDKHSDENATKPAEKDNQADQVNEGRKLFAHYLWNAAIVVAEGVEDAYYSRAETPQPDKKKEPHGLWQVEGETVLELGAGAALPSLICALANAAKVVATDHPFSPALSGTIASNIASNLHHRPTADVPIHPHEWGVFSDPFARQNKGAFTRIIAADCFWQKSQHESLARSMAWFLAPGGKVWVVSEPHLGCVVVAGFFEMMLAMGFEIELAFERDLAAYIESGVEVRREWVPVREGEDEHWRRWCVIAVLKRGGRS